MELPVSKNDKFTYSDKIPQGFYKAVMGDWSLPYESVFLEDPVEGVAYYEAINFCNRLCEIYEIAPTYLVFSDGSIFMNNPKGVRLLTEEELKGLNIDMKGYQEWSLGGKVVGEGLLLSFRVCMNH